MKATLTFFLVLLLSQVAELHAADVAEQLPNVVFILADDLGWADTTLYSHTKFYKTPNIDRLAQRGMVFTHAYSASPLCSPTRSAVLTGLSPARTGITTPNCHVPQVVLRATTGTKAAPDQKAIQPQPVTRLKTGVSHARGDVEGLGLCDRALWKMAPRAGSLFAVAAGIRC